MKTKLMILFIYLMAAVTPGAYADPPESTVSSLGTVGPLIASIEEWDGIISVVAEEYQPEKRASKRTFHYIDLIDKFIKPLIVKDGYDITALGENKQHAFALCSKNKDLFLFRKSRLVPNASWEMQKLDFKIDGTREIKLAANDIFLFILSANHIWASRDAEPWRKIALNEIIGERKEVEPWPNWNSPHKVLATNNNLFLGYNGGEFGGAAYAIPLNGEGISGAGLRIGSFNVCGLKEDRYGNDWIAGGLAHMGIRKAHLYQYNHGKIAVIIDQKGYQENNLTKFFKKEEQAKLEIPITDIKGLAINAEGNPVLVGSEIGVFEYATGKISPVIKADMHGPVGIVIKNDDIYLASRSMGVYEFKKKNQRYEFQLITFESN